MIYSKGPVTWSCAKQGSITTSTTKAELNTIHYCVDQFIYMTKIFNTIRLQAKTTPILYNNNQLALAIIHSSQTNFHRVKKHYNMKLKRMIEIVKLGALQIKHMLSDVMITDMLTKALRLTKLLKLTQHAGLLQLPSLN